MTFIPTKKDFKQVKSVLRNLEKTDETFSFDRNAHLLSFEDEDEKRAFRRAMWIKESLAKKEIDIDFIFAKYRVKHLSRKEKRAE